MSVVGDHPVWGKTSVEDAVAFARACEAEGRVVSARDAWVELERARALRIARAEENPLVFGWEPPIWRVADALLGLDWVIPERFGKDYGPRMRRLLLGKDKPVAMLMIFGGNRSGKTTYLLKRSLQCGMHFDSSMTWIFHTDLEMSRVYHQKEIWKFMPAEYKKKRGMKTEDTYIAYKAKTGFSENSFILPNMSWFEFRGYVQDRMKIEGGRLGNPAHGPAVGFVADEEIPEDWVDTLSLRIAEYDARGLFGFTPVNGYTGVAKMFLQGARVVRSSPAWLFPKNGGAASERAFEVEDCDGWLEEEKTTTGMSSVREEGRGEGAPAPCDFDTTPRVMVCADSTRACLFFHTSDNPFGNPRSVWEKISQRPAAYQRERFYGVADGQRAGQFPLFRQDVHVIAEGKVPRDEKGKLAGTVFMYLDPCEGRNFFMSWILATEAGRHFVFDEWPNQVDAIPGVGVMEEWAIPGTGKLFDGRQGPAQESLGWGLLQYKKEIARVEGWHCYREEASPDEVRGWDQYGPKERAVFARYMDARFGNTEVLQEDGKRTLFDEFEDIGLTFLETTAATRTTIEDGVVMMNSALNYDPSKPLVPGFNYPKLFFSERVKNTIFAFQIWTNRDGSKGATKDPVDNVRYHFLKGNEFVRPVNPASMGGGGCYGRIGRR